MGEKAPKNSEEKFYIVRSIFLMDSPTWGLFRTSLLCTRQILAESQEPSYHNEKKIESK